MQSPNLISTYSISFPIIAAEKVINERYLISGDICGTAFALGTEYFMTAGHVASSAPHSNNQQLVIGILGPDGFFKAAPIIETEDIGTDIALLKVRFPFPESEKRVQRLKWSEKSIDTFEHIRVAGYAYGLHVVGENKSVVIRGFQGHVVTSLLEFLPPGMKGKPFKVYELSFAAPRGLSGSPLLNCHGTILIHGVLIGNRESRMSVFRDEEKVSDQQGVICVERYEALTLGIAVTANEILPRESRLLNGSIREYLRKNLLLE